MCKKEDSPFTNIGGGGEFILWWVFWPVIPALKKVLALDFH